MFKKYLLLSFCALFASAFSFAQKSAIDRAAIKMCDYIKKDYDTAKPISQSQLSGFFTTAFAKVCSEDLEKLMKEIGEKNFDKEAGKKLGEKIGLKLAMMCPEYMVMIRKSMESEPEKKEQSENDFSINGNVESIITTNYTYINVRDESNKVVKLVWLENFEGAEKVNNNPEKLEGKRVYLKYLHKDLYDKRNNSFRTEKVITFLSVD